MWSVLLLGAAAHAASLDQIEQGGLWGTPNATDATALWWNPAGLAAGSGTRLMLEGAPIHARVRHDRVQAYDDGGTSRWMLNAALPYAGIVSDAGIDGFGFGLGMAVPYARGARAIDDENFGPARYSLRSAQVQSIHIMGGAGWRPHKVIAFGATGQVALSQWTSDLDSETLTSLAESVEEARGSHDYEDSMIEDPNYATRLTFGHLNDTAATFSAGVRLMPSDKLNLSATWIHGYRVDNSGSLTLTFDCPPQSDTYGRYGAEAQGLCYSQLEANAVVGYNLPHRLHGGIQFLPNEDTTLELLGGWVAWSRYDDLDITVKDTGELNELPSEETADKLDQNRKWARANVDSGWVGLDAKVQITETVKIGGRYIFDRSAIPDEAIHPNNYDANAHMFSGMAAVAVSSSTELGLSVSHHRLVPRDVRTNNFNVSLEEPSEDRWNYPRMNGAYFGNITRAGIQVRSRFGKERYEQDLMYDRPGEKTRIQVPPEGTPSPEDPPAAKAPIKVTVGTPDQGTATEAPPTDAPTAVKVQKRDPDTFPGRLERVGTVAVGEVVIPRKDVGSAASPADFLARLWAGYGAPGTKLPNGFIYEFEDLQTGLRFQARADENGSVYLPAADQADDQRLTGMLEAFDLWLQAQEPADCEIKVRSEAGAFTWGSRMGKPFVTTLDETPAPPAEEAAPVEEAAPATEEAAPAEEAAPKEDAAPEEETEPAEEPAPLPPEDDELPEAEDTP